jgi:hypothetical protein
MTLFALNEFTMRCFKTKIYGNLKNYSILCQRARPPGLRQKKLVILIMTKLKSRRQAPTKSVILIMGRENFRKAFGTIPKGAGKTTARESFFRESFFRENKIIFYFVIACI